MKKYYLITVVTVFLAVMATLAFVSSGVRENVKNLMARSVEVLSKDENNNDGSTPVIIVVCHCNAFLGHTCRANHSGSTCAGGENVQCSSYDGNC